MSRWVIERARARAAVARAQELDAKSWLTKEEAADYARCSTTTLDRAVHDGELRVGGPRGTRLFRRAWLDTWLGLALAVVVAVLIVLAGLCFFVDVLPCPYSFHGRLPVVHRHHAVPSASRRVHEHHERGHEDERYLPGRHVGGI